MTQTEHRRAKSSHHKQKPKRVADVEGGFHRCGEYYRCQGPRCKTTIKVGAWCFIYSRGVRLGQAECHKCAIRLKDDKGRKISGGYERARLWAVIADRNNL